MDSSKLKKMYKNLKYKYRLVLYNESTFDPEYSFVLSGLNVILFFCTTLLAGLLIAVFLIVYTPLKFYLPGVGEAGVQKQMRKLYIESEVLKKKAKENELWAKNIKEVLSGELNSSNLKVEDENIKDTLN